MNNEETTNMQQPESLQNETPQADQNETLQTDNVIEAYTVETEPTDTPKMEQPSNTGRKAAAVAAAAVGGGIFGVAGTAAAMKVMNSEKSTHSESESKTADAKANEHPVAHDETAQPVSTEEIHTADDVSGTTEAEHHASEGSRHTAAHTHRHDADSHSTDTSTDTSAEAGTDTSADTGDDATTGEDGKEVNAYVDEDGNPDYTGHNGEDYVEDGASAQNASLSDGDVQVLGVYETTSEEGVRQEVAIISDGNESGALIDTTGDGKADILWVDEDHNQQMAENELYDVSDRNVDMSTYEQQYAESQMQQEQQDLDQQDVMYASDNQQDYNNNADIQFA